MENGLTRQANSLQARIVSGSVVLLVGSGLTTGINLIYNVLIARYLGPTGYGQAAVVYTLLTLLSAVTLSFQIISAKFAAQQSPVSDKGAVYRYFHQSAWVCGSIVGVTLLIFRDSVASYLNLTDPILVALLAIGAAFYIPLGSRRGYIQGNYGFRRLALNLVLEGAVRLIGSYVLVLMGLGVRGVIEANVAAVAIAYFEAVPKLGARISSPLNKRRALRETSQALVFFSGQVLINNCDIVLVKHFFAAEAAGLYAAVAMVGRVVFAFSQAIVNSTFPLVAGTCEAERKDLKVIATSLLLVIGCGSVLAIGLWITPPPVWTSLFGSAFKSAGEYSLSSLLSLYALETVVYSLSVVIITFEMSYKIANSSWVQLAFSGVVIAGICSFHSTVHQVIIVKLILMVGLFACVAIPFLFESLTGHEELDQDGVIHPVRIIRPVAEDEVIAEFLKADFRQQAFRAYRAALGKVVSHPNLDDTNENAIRRALLFTRHFSLWKEIPEGTRWYEIEITEPDLGQISVFPRAQWRKVARGNFSLTKILESLRARRYVVDESFLSKIADISNQFLKGNGNCGAVLLIGVNERNRLTVLDGNHRMVAATLTSPGSLKDLRFLCGLSPRMTECCWYKTNLVNLARYARNVMTNVFRRPEAELAHLLRNAGKSIDPADTLRRNPTNVPLEL